MSETMAIQYVDTLESKLQETSARLLDVIKQRDELVAATARLMRAMTLDDCTCEMCKAVNDAIANAQARSI